MGRHPDDTHGSVACNHYRYGSMKRIPYSCLSLFVSLVAKDRYEDITRNT